MTEEFIADDDGARLRILDDVQHLRRREPPIHRNANGAQFREAEDDLEEFGAVLLDEGDAIAETHARRPERLRDLAGTGIELRERKGPVAGDQRHGIRSPRRVDAHDVGDAGDGGVRHGQALGCMRCRFIRASTAPGAKLLASCAVTAIRGAMRTGRTRAAVIIQSAASAALRPGRPS